MIEEPLSLESGEPKESDCRNQALRYLVRREHSVFEMSLKLRRKGYSGKNCDAALSRLVSENLLSDCRYATCYLESRAKKGYGPTRIRLALEQKGVHRATVDEALEESEIEWAEQLKRQLVKKFGESEPTNYKEWVQRARYLNNRGFSSELIQSILEFSA
jgi:regulatory protein